jgi:uncharacterized protein YndB with AHSA1/START domain
MPDILHEVPINGTPEKIYQALTDQSGLRAWWTTAASAQPKVGTVSEFEFYGGQIHMKIKVDEIRPEHISWSPLEGVPDWPGTQITWDISPGENGGTKLLFGHRNFGSYEGSFAYTNFNWGWYLSSLKAYVESGVGKPHTGDPNT